MIKRGTSSVFREPFKAAALVLAMASCVATQAAENSLQRYSPGVGGSDMTAPLTPGWYFQMPIVAYHANKIKGNDGRTATQFVPAAGTYATQSIDATTVAMLPRLTYLDTKRVLGANVGLTVMLPLVRREAEFGARIAGSGGLVDAVNGGLRAAAAAQSGQVSGIGDVEVSPIMHWEIGDHQSATFAPTVVLPTGDYVPGKRLNPGYGNFVTFRPSIQYAFIGDGWDVGARMVLSFNTRNKDTNYYSGNMFNLDWQLMKFVTEDLRAGVQGYFVRQLNHDTQDRRALDPSLYTTTDLSHGNKASANAIGPAFGWLRNGGEFLLEGKFLKEFNARNRPEGQAWWLTISKPL